MEISKRVGVGLLLVVCVVGGGSVAGGQEGPRDVAIVDVTLLDGIAPEPRERMTVLVSAGRITDVGPRAQIRIPYGARRIDGRGLFLIPGLWDAHAHLSYWGEDALGRLVASGVTGVRELGGDPDEIAAWRAAVASGRIVGPRIVWAGPFLEGSGGGEEYRWIVDTPAEARQAARTLAARGVDFLKIQPRIEPEVVEALVEEAAELGLDVVGHLPDGMTLEGALEAGLRSIEHMSPYAGLDAGEVERAARLFLRHDARMSPALFSLMAPLEAAGEDPTRDPDVRHAFEVVQAFHEAGVGILVGSNFAYRDWPQQPGTSLHEEMRVLVEAGMEPVDVLRAATSEIAAFLGLADRTGAVREGLAADLVLLEADPLEDIRNVRRIRAVVLGGRVLEGLR